MKVIDMHCDTICKIAESRKQGKQVGLNRNSFMVDLEKMKKGGYSVQNFALFVERKFGESPFSEVMHLYEVFREEIEKNKDLITQVYTTKDIIKNEKEGKLSALLTVEEGGVCEGKLEYLHILYQKGVRMMTLTWNQINEIGYPNFRENQDCYTEELEFGLTDKGICFIEEMEKIGMLIDVSHLSDAGFYDVWRHTRKPFVASHSNSRVCCPWARNLTDDMIRKIGERGGVIGLNYCADFLKDIPFYMKGRRPTENKNASMQEVVFHAKHMKNIGGIECIGLGSDFDGIPPHPELKSAADIPHLIELFKKGGFYESEIDKILYQNVFRIYEML